MPDLKKLCFTNIYKFLPLLQAEQSDVAETLDEETDEQSAVADTLSLRGPPSLSQDSCVAVVVELWLWL